MDKKELRERLRAKISEKKIDRFGKKQKEITLEKSLQDLNIDYKKFRNDLENVKKEGGLTLNIKN